jgi:hypothetical protein
MDTSVKRAMTMTQRQVHLAFWLVVGPAMTLLVLMAILHRPAQATMNDGTEAAVGTQHER